MLVSNAIVYASLAVIATGGSEFPSPLDGVVWLTVVLALAARHLDITRWAGKTASGEPATLSHWRRYMVIIVVVTAVASLIAHAIGG